LPHLAELFCKIGCEILNNLRKDPRDPGMTVVKILNRWRELLGKEESRILGDEQLAGLIGELLLLSTLATNSHDAIYCWVGPEGQTKDFSGREWDIEVKARLSVNRKFVKINGIEQLERRKDTSLLLAVYTLLKKKQGAINLPQLVEDLIDKGLDEVELLSRLREVGYQLGDREHYLSRCFELAGLSAYLVEEEFPRLVGTKLKEPLAAEISSVSYLLDLSKQESMTPEQFGDFVSTLEVP
jgi:aryl carrier-like protein